MAKKVPKIVNTPQKWVFFLLGFFCVVGAFSLFTLSSKILPQTSGPFVAKPTPTQQSTVFYNGESGKDALTLLKQQASIEQNASGMVVAINGRRADEKSHEYWSFSVNGKMAQVGPADYQTNSTDRIEWRIEYY